MIQIRTEVHRKISRVMKREKEKKNLKREKDGILEIHQVNGDSFKGTGQNSTGVYLLT